LSAQPPPSEFDEEFPYNDTDSASESSESRRGRARERHRRRLEKRQGVGQAAGARGPSHLSTAPNIRLSMPDIPVSSQQLRLVGYGVGSALLVIIVILLLGRLKGDDAVTHPNAIWIGTEWTYQLHEPQEIETLVRLLRDHHIGVIYAWVSWLQADETWRGAENFATVRQFAEQFKQAYPEAELYGWLGFPVNIGPNNYRLDNEDLQRNIADFSARVVSDLGFDGVFLNVEPVWDGDDNLLALLRKVRASVGESVPVSVATPPDWSPLGVDIPLPPLIVPGTIWDKPYKQSVALLTDQMAVMAYNSGLTADAGFTPEDYSRWMAYQVQVFAEAVSELRINTQVLIGIPTYEAEPPGHDPTVENLASAIAGVRLGLAAAGEAAGYIRGVAIYAGWTTDEADWLQFRSLWVNR
jgi:hypothetical protein